MSGFVGEELKVQIRTANDIVEVIQELSVPLKKAGNHYRALCPFHKEKTPSFYVSPQRQSFHCFGCGTGGDVFKFVMLREGIDFPASLRRLAERIHITIPENRGDSGTTRDQRERLYELHRKVRDWFHMNLMRARRAEAARAYLRERGFSASTARKFYLGYALPSWDGLIQWGRAHGVDVAFLEEAGFVVKGNRGAYDRFRDRLMIPIADEMGRVVGFSGRILTKDTKEAKYVNSPETAIFKKGRLLFGLDRSKRALQEAKTAIVCEGQLDWIRCFESGIDHVIAPQGTAFTEEQARILSRYVDEVVLCFDSDSAGQKATWRNAEILIAAGLSVRAARIPEGEDPDSFIRKSGTDAFKKRITEAVDVFEYKALSFVRSLDMRNPRNHQKVILEITPLLVLIESEPQRQRFIANICDILKMDPVVFQAEFQRQARRSRQGFISSVGVNQQGVEVRDSLRDRMMEYGDYLLRLSLTEESAARMLADHLEEPWFSTYGLRHVLFHVIQRTKEGSWKPGWDILDLELDEATKERIAWLLMYPIKMTHRAMATGLQDAVAGVRRAHLHEEYQKRAKLLQKTNLNEIERLQFQTELLDLARRMKQV